MDPARRRWALAALGFALLLICARWQLGDFASFAGAQDLDFFDESQYLAAGAYAKDVTHISPQWAPPYCLWYRALFRLSGDAVVTYHLNAYLLAFALPALWYLFCIALGMAPWWALASALAWLVSSANLETLRVGNFAMCLVLGGLLVSRLARPPAIAWWLAAAALWVAGSVRLELMPAAAIVVAVGAWQLHRQWQSLAKTAAWIVAAMLPNLLLDALFGWPLGGGRSGAAFQQHLAGNILDWHRQPFANWIHYEDVIRQYYRLPSSALDFALHEPLAFAHHVATNAWRLLSESIFHALSPAAHAALVVPIAAAILGGAAMKLRGARGAMVIGPVSVTLIASTAMVLVSCLVIYPREHYLPLLLSTLLFSLAPYGGEARGGEVRGGHARAALIAMMVLAAVFAIAPTYPQSRASAPRPQEATLEALRKLAPPQLTLFDDSGVLQVYVPAQRFGPRDFKPPFDQFLRERQINVVVISPKLGLDPLLAPDPAWQQFVRDPASLGFRCESIPRSERTLCLKPG